MQIAVRMGFLTFLPFLLIGEGAALPIRGFALAPVFIGGAAGKFACSWLGERVGTTRTPSFSPKLPRPFLLSAFCSCRSYRPSCCCRRWG